MASEETGDADVSLAVPAEVEEWLDAEAKRRGTDREPLCRRLLAAGRVAATDDFLRPVDRDSLEDLRARVDTQRDEFVELVEDVRERVIQVKRETDAKAPTGHDHQDLARADEIESVRADLEAVATDLERVEDADADVDLETQERDLEALETDLEGGEGDLAELTSTATPSGIASRATSSTRARWPTGRSGRCRSDRTVTAASSSPNRRRRRVPTRGRTSSN